MEDIVSFADFTEDSEVNVEERDGKQEDGEVVMHS